MKNNNKNKTEIEIPSLEQLEAERKRYKYKEKYKHTLKSTVAILIVAAAVAILIATLWMPVLQVYGSSMAPSLEDGQIIVSIKDVNLKTGELAAFYWGEKLLIKRVIAGPGDWVNITDEGDVYINGEPIDEPYLKEKALGECDITFPYQVPEERWFVMGDNRAVSIDSRSSEIGCISQDRIEGKIILRIWPFDKIGLPS